MNNFEYDVPADLRIPVIDLIRSRKLAFSLKLDKKYFADVLELPNKITAAEADVSITLNQKDIFVNGSVRGRRELVCGRCLSKFTDVFNRDFSEVLHTDAQIIDIMSLVRESLLLTEDIRFLCKQDCKGLCDICGENKNITPCSCVKEVFSPFSVLKKK